MLTSRQASHRYFCCRPCFSSVHHQFMSGFPLDRKAMEEERLARLAARKKRERSISPPVSQTSRKAPKLEETATTLASGARLNFIYTPTSDTPKQAGPPVMNNEIKRENADVDPALKYPRGVVLRTWAFGHDRNEDVKIEEVLEARTLRTAVLSSFQWDPDWVFSKLRTPLSGGQTKCVFVMEAKDQDLRRQILSDTEDKRAFLRICFPPMDGAWCMHSKLMLLFHPTKLRVAIPTANLLNFDWGETGVMENSVFMVDLPRLPEGHTQIKDQLTPFGKELLLFVERQGLDQDIRDGLLKFDFSLTTDIAFVHSIGGTSYQNEASRTGLRGLSSAVRSLGLETTKELEIDFAASSIGSLKDEFLQNLHTSARGVDLAGRVRTSSTQAKKAFFEKSSQKSHDAVTEIRKAIRIYFPTDETARASRAGGAGSICLQRQWFEASTFPRSIFRDYVSSRSGLLSHNKILCARGLRRLDDSSGCGTKVAWLYVGSANASMSAWGTIPKDGKERISCRNWECGVLMPVPQSRLEDEQLVKPKQEHIGDAGTKREQVQHRKQMAGESQVQVKVEKEDSETESEDDTKDSNGARKQPSKVGTKSDGSETESDGEYGRVASSEVLMQIGAREETEGARSVHSLPSMQVFEGLITLPFVFPGAEYRGREPWYFDPRSKAARD